MVACAVSGTRWCLIEDFRAFTAAILASADAEGFFSVANVLFASSSMFVVKGAEFAIL